VKLSSPGSTFPKGLRWLDVGCGNGAFTEEIIARCAPATVMAIDPSDEQLAFARTRPGAKMAKFEVGDAHKLLFGDGTFDVAIMALVLAFLLNPAKAVAEMARVVRPGGWVAVAAEPAAEAAKQEDDENDDKYES
jgi:ubiquinone/menaquinone biosynthesis C-methylase UbiE